ncbi:MAG TPA: thioredoxin domain-containing protein [Cellulomonas sp.]
MSAHPSGQQKLPKKDRKALARELAKIEREREVARRRRNRRLGWTGAGTVVVAAGVVTALVLQSSARAAAVGPHNMLSDGLVLTGDGSTITAKRTSAIGAGEDASSTVVDRTAGVIDIVVYQDYRSPDAATFWTAASSAVEQWVTAGYATLELHPLALLDGTTVTTAPAATSSPTADATAAATAAPTTAAPTTDPDSLLGTMQTTGDYSARAAGAFACVADTQPDSALAVNDALLAAQPDLTEAGLADDDLLALVQNAGVTDETVADCVTSGSFTDWAQEATDRAAQSVPFDVGTVTTSPVVIIGGEQYTGALDDADALTTFIGDVASRLSEEAAASAEATATATPTPDASATPEVSEEATTGTDQ